MSVKLIMFDLDGTLVDTSQDITNALNYAGEPFALKKLTTKETIAMIGEGVTRLIEKACGEDKPDLKERVIERFLDYYSTHLTDHSVVYPNVTETLEKLYAYRKVVISNKRENLSVQLLDTLRLLKYFDLVVGSDTTAEKKPSAVPLLHVLEKLHSLPEEALMVGDSKFDIEAGKRAGVKTLAVVYGYGEKQHLLEADYVIDSFDALPRILDMNSSKLI
ncbi:MAG: HAD-IA family hydrolase [Thermodesulfovibrionales bacterium]|nr:HAD-IA family hydrolase [Thermodesulfovibrionales bacterium]